MSKPAQEKKATYADTLKSATVRPTVSRREDVDGPVSHRARNCCGVRPMTLGSARVARVGNDLVKRARDPAFAFGGDALIDASSLRQGAYFEVVLNNTTRRSNWLSTRHFEYSNNLVQIPAGSRLYLSSPRVAGMTRLVRLRLDGRSWWKRQDIDTISSSLERAVRKVTTVSGAPQFVGSRTTRTRRRNHRGKASLARRRQKRREAVKGLKQTARRANNAIEQAAGIIENERLKVLEAEVVAKASKALVDLLAVSGPVVRGTLDEDTLPGVSVYHDEARNDVVKFLVPRLKHIVALPRLLLLSKFKLYDFDTAYRPVSMISDGKNLLINYDYMLENVQAVVLSELHLGKDGKFKLAPNTYPAVSQQRYL